MDTCELYIEVPAVDIDYPCHTGEYQYRWDVPDPSIDDAGDTEGYHLYRCPKAELIERGRPVCNVDDLVRKVISGRFDRHEMADEIDTELNSILHKRLSVDLRMGETLKALRRQGVQRLGYRSLGDFTVEHLSFSGRLASEMVRNFDVLSKLPFTKRAYLQCGIMKSALRHTSRVMTPENEAEWLSLAKTLTLNDLIREVKLTLETTGTASTSGTDSATETNSTTGTDSIFFKKWSLSPNYPTQWPSEESHEETNGVMMHFNVRPKLALIWDMALSHFRDSEQHSGAVSEFVDALLGSYLSSGNCRPGKRGPGNYRLRYQRPECRRPGSNGAGNGRNEPDKTELPADAAGIEYPVFYSCHMKADDDEKLLRLGDYEPPKRDESGTCENGSNRENMLIIFPASFDEIPGKARDTAERLVEYAQMRQALDAGMGRLLWAMRYRSLYRIFECGSIEEYAIQYCDLSKPLLYRLLKLAAGLERRGRIKDAFESGLISKEQAGLILKIADDRNETAWIDYAAHVPTSALKEEVERCVRIVQYDCMTPGNYTMLPGFRYISDERFHELSDEMKEIIRTGAWYESPTPGWPLEEDDEWDVINRDRRLEEPWKYFEDVDEFLIYEAEAAERKKKPLCAREKGQKMSGRDGASSLCADVNGQDALEQNGISLLCADSKTADCCCKSHVDCHCSCDSINRPGYSEDALSKAREIVKMPQGSDPAETFLLDILADDDNDSDNSDSDVNGDSDREDEPRRKSATMPIRFFLPEEMLEIWNFTAILYLESISAQSAIDEWMLNLRSIHELPPSEPDLYEGFLAAMLQEYLLGERIHLKVSRSYAILKRDRFRCQVPGCRCRRNLEVHHIIWRSKGGSDEHSNLLTLCKSHHSYILHELMALKIEGTAPDNLTFTFDPHPENGGGPLLIYQNGRKLQMRRP